MSENMTRFVNEAANGSTEAMGKLYSKTLKASCFLSTGLCIDPVLSEEVTKKAYARAFCNVSKLKKPEAFEIWMKQNIALAFKEAVSLNVEEYEGSANPGSPEFLPEYVLTDASASAAVSSSIDALETNERTALLLYYNNGMPVASLAKFLGVSENTVNHLLASAREHILMSCGIERAQAEPGSSKPVLTRLLQQFSDNGIINGTAVRDIFSYAINAYNESVPAKPVVAQKPVETAEKSSSATDAGSFKSRIDDILSGRPVKEDEPVAKPKETPTSNTGSGDVISIPEFKKSALDNVVDEIGTDDNEQFDSEEVDPEFDLSQNSKIDIQKIKDFVQNNKFLQNKKLVAICAGVLALVLLVIIIAICASGGKNNENDVNNVLVPGVSTSEIVSTTKGKHKDNIPAYNWVAGGFEQCADIAYLDENCLRFKSVDTEKYGLLDYEGNVLLEPLYSEFTRCGYGRDYSQRDSYHSLVNIDGTKYEFTISATGEVKINDIPHNSHTLAGDEFSSKTYDERDRYFEGYAAARKDGKWGYVSQEKDKKVIPYEYEAVNDLQQYETASCDYCRGVTGGLIAVKKDGRMGIINLDNDVVVPFEYSNIMPGKNGVFIACKNDTWGVILIGDAINTFKGIKLDFSNISTETPVNTNREIGRYVTIDGGANIRSGPDLSYDEVGDIAQHVEIAAYAITENEVSHRKWVYVNYRGVKGWVAMSRLTEVS